MMKVLVLDGVEEEGLAALMLHPDIEVDVRNKLTEDEICAIIADYDGMIVRSATKVTARIFEHADNLKVVGRAGVGVDNIDLAAATDKGVLVVNAPDGNTIAAAEHTIAMMMALARNIPQACSTLRAGKWDRKSFMGVELRDKVLGIIGLGRIGSAVAKRAQGLEMKVVAYDPYLTEEKAQLQGHYCTGARFFRNLGLLWRSNIHNHPTFEHLSQSFFHSPGSFICHPKLPPIEHLINNYQIILH
jgi:D-3-phosphoglycerate dehydrogenase